MAVALFQSSPFHHTGRFIIMTPLVFSLLLATSSADPPPDTSKPVGMTRDEEKELLEKHKKAKPRLPFPPADPDKPQQGVNNGWFRSYYVPADLRGTVAAVVTDVARAGTATPRRCSTTPSR